MQPATINWMLFSCLSGIAYVLLVFINQLHLGDYEINARMSKVISLFLMHSFRDWHTIRYPTGGINYNHAQHKLDGNLDQLLNASTLSCVH